MKWCTCRAHRTARSCTRNKGLQYTPGGTRSFCRRRIWCHLHPLGTWQKEGANPTACRLHVCQFQPHSEGHVCGWWRPRSDWLGPRSTSSRNLQPWGRRGPSKESDTEARLSPDQAQRSAWSAVLCGEGCMQPARKMVAMLKKACPYQTGIAAALTRMTRPGDMTGQYANHACGYRSWKINIGLIKSISGIAGRPHTSLLQGMGSMSSRFFHPI